MCHCLRAQDNTHPKGGQYEYLCTCAFSDVPEVTTNDLVSILVHLLSAV